MDECVHCDSKSVDPETKICVECKFDFSPTKDEFSNEPCDYHEGLTVDPETRKCSECGYDYSGE